MSTECADKIYQDLHSSKRGKRYTSTDFNDAWVVERALFGIRGTAGNCGLEEKRPPLGWCIGTTG